MNAKGKIKRSGRPLRSSEISLEACPELDRGSNVPLYYQLAANLFEALDARRPEADAPFPTERELEQRFVVSRAVVRDALKLLVGDGAIYRVQGQGAFVSPKRRQLRPQGLISVISGRQDRLSLQILDAGLRKPRPTVARELELRTNSKTGAVMSVLLQDGEPVALLDSHSSPAVSSRVLAVADSLRRKEGILPERQGWKLTKAFLCVEQTCLGHWSAPKFGCAAGDPALMVHIVQLGMAGRSERERPLEYAHLIYPSRSVQLTTELR